ncbi:MAG: phosphodiester glycosidase family protein, partial [Myxococcota bacterium]
VDSAGRAVFFHSRTPYRMSDVSRMLAEPSLGLRGMIYLEGGPEASLVLQGEGERVTEVGSYEDDFNENDDNRAFWDLPNIIAAAPR